MIYFVDFLVNSLVEEKVNNSNRGHVEEGFPLAVIQKLSFYLVSFFGFITISCLYHNYQFDQEDEL